MAGKMTGKKKGLMRKGKPEEKSPPPPPPKDPPRNPRSANIREANGGYVMSAHGGDNPMGDEHVAPDLESMIERMRGHMSAAEVKEMLEEEAAAEDAPPPKKKAKKKLKIPSKADTY